MLGTTGKSSVSMGGPSSGDGFSNASRLKRSFPQCIGSMRISTPHHTTPHLLLKIRLASADGEVFGVLCPWSALDGLSSIAEKHVLFCAFVLGPASFLTFGKVKCH